MFEEFRPEELQCSGIYMILNTVNNKCYIGSADISFRRRWYNHISQLRNNKHHSSHLQRSWNKYKENSFKFIILEFTVKCESKNYILSREQHYINFYLPQYNIAKIAGSNKGNKSRLGKITSLEHRNKISIAASGRKHTLETRHKLSLANKHKGVNHPRYGKVGEANCLSKWYKAISPEGTVHIFKGLANFCKTNNLNQAHMTSVTSGKLKHHKGWFCEHYEESFTA